MAAFTESDSDTISPVLQDPAHPVWISAGNGLLSLDNYPISLVRTVAEFRHLVEDLQAIGKRKVATQAGWRLGFAVIVRSPASVEAARAPREHGLQFADWFFDERKLA